MSFRLKLLALKLINDVKETTLGKIFSVFTVQVFAFNFAFPEWSDSNFIPVESKKLNFEILKFELSHQNLHQK